MKEKTVIYVCLLTGIIMLLDPFIGIILFLEGLSNDVAIIFFYMSLFAALFVIIGAFLARSDYTPLGMDYLKISINSLWISLVIGVFGMILFNVLVTIPTIDHPLDISIVYVVIYNIIEIVSILIILFLIMKLNKILKTHEHGKEFTHHK
ncbi:MAG: hypothetical protein JW891_13330 [Candidatus Lokiarchaeota archaeon]|nr:hypothetical protein [Candidatus Lokiarchaeota archaeon]